MLKHPAQLTPIQDLSLHFEDTVEQVYRDRCPASNSRTLTGYEIKLAALHLSQAFLYLAQIDANASYRAISEAFEGKVSAVVDSVQQARNPYTGHQTANSSRYQLSHAEKLHLAALEVQMYFQQEATAAVYSGNS